MWNRWIWMAGTWMLRKQADSKNNCKFLKQQMLVSRQKVDQFKTHSCLSLLTDSNSFFPSFFFFFSFFFFPKQLSVLKKHTTQLNTHNICLEQIFVFCFCFWRWPSEGADDCGSLPIFLKQQMLVMR